MFGFKKNEKPTLIIEAKDLMEIIKSDYDNDTIAAKEITPSPTCFQSANSPSYTRLQLILPKSSITVLSGNLNGIVPDVPPTPPLYPKPFLSTIKLPVALNPV